jgi:hypothetical protein
MYSCSLTHIKAVGAADNIHKYAPHQTIPNMATHTPSSFFGGMSSPKNMQPPVRMMTAGAVGRIRKQVAASAAGVLTAVACNPGVMGMYE